MLKEILEQPQGIRCALRRDRNEIMEIAVDILRARQIVLTACGTSRYTAIIGRYVFSRLASMFSDVISASESHYFSHSVDKNAVAIAVSQSGERADVMKSVKMARENAAAVFSAVNVVGLLPGHSSWPGGLSQLRARNRCRDQAIYKLTGHLIRPGFAMVNVSPADGYFGRKDGFPTARREQSGIHCQLEKSVGEH